MKKKRLNEQRFTDLKVLELVYKSRNCENVRTLVWEEDTFSRNMVAPKALRKRNPFTPQR